MVRQKHNAVNYGFTLIELMVVMGIISILAGLIISVLPTEEGKKLYQLTISGAAEYTHDFLSALGKNEQRELHRMLQKVSHSLGYKWQ